MAAVSPTQSLLAQLRLNGWTYAAIADELGVKQPAVQRWASGERSPSNPLLVSQALTELLGRKRVPKQRRYAPGSRTS